MNNAGYSDKPLIEKLGYQPGERVLVVEGAASFMGYLQEQGVEVSETFPVDWLHAFFTNRTDLDRWARATDFSQVGHGVWVSWPKKSSHVETNLTEQSFRDTLLPLGLVDTKVCAIDEVWSGLKFVARKTID